MDYVACNNEKVSLLLESVLHDKYAKYHRRREWFDYDKRLFNYNILNEEAFKLKQTRSPLNFQTLFGLEEKFNVNDAPRCHFYPNLSAHIIDRYENSVNKKVPFRTMAWPTHGKSMLLPYSDKKDRVFISCKKHEQNLEEKKFRNTKEKTASLDNFLTCE
jgi:hypothetical protein